MNDYNDGKWHGWNGGECPVHPMSVVEVLSGILPGQRNIHNRHAGQLVWDCIVAFRVVTPYVEQPKPREWWATGRHLHDSLAEAEAFIAKVRAENPHLDFADHDPLHVREVLE
jgi:hypothetical protein